ATTPQPPSLTSVYRNLTQQTEIAEHAAGAEDHRCQRIVGNRHRQAGLFPNAFIQILDQRAATGEHDAAVADVGAQLGWCPLQGDADGVDDGGHALAQGFADFAVVDGNGARHAFNQIAPLDLHGERLIQRIGRADFHLDGFGGALADQQVVLAFHELHDGVVHFVARHAHAARVHDAGKRDDGHVGGAAPDIHYHVARGFGDRQSGADGRHHRLFHQVHFARLGAVRRVHDGALFHLRDFAGHADDDARMHQHFPAVRLLNKVVQHALGDFEVGDHTVLHGFDGDDVAGRAAQHLFRLLANRLHLAIVLVDGDDGRLVDDDSLTL